MNTRTVTIELAWRVETSHTIEVPIDQELGDCEEPLVQLTAEVDDGRIDGVVDCYKFQVTDKETGKVWQK
jgi:hypothetical protein